MFREQSIAPEVLQSWERCVRYGLKPAQVAPRPTRDTETDARLIDVTTDALQSRTDAIERSGVCLSLTDATGVVLRQWVGNKAIMSRFELLGILPGFEVAETIVGNSSGSALITRGPVMVRGPEHFAPQFASLTSAGNVITHPVTRRVVGSLNLTCQLADTSPMALSWVCEMVADIERRLLESATTAEQLLLRSFLKENRDARHAVVAVNAQTAMTNAAAATLLGSIDQAQLWEYGASLLAGNDEGAPTLTRADGSSLRVHRSAVVGAGESLGVVLKLTRVTDGRRARPEPLAEMPGLVGSSPQWNRMRRRLASAGQRNVLLFGASGVGKSSVARALAGAGVVELEGAGVNVLDEVRQALSTNPPALALRHLDSVPSERAGELAAMLGSAPAGVRLLATSRRAPASGTLAPSLQDLFPEVVPVPGLDERSEDIPAIIANLTQRHVIADRTVHWMPDAVQAVSRRAWPENVRALDILVKHVVSGVRRDYIGLRDLPAHVSSRAGRRQLGGLERVEAEAILQALRDSAWNKQEAAEALGIARSTLYRKMQALGLDRDATF
jgi:transcriptional regulator of acetoin/glycerol metabolism